MEIRDGLLYSTNNYWVALKSRLAEDEERNQQRMEKVEMVGSLSHLFSTRIYNFCSYSVTCFLFASFFAWSVIPWAVCAYSQARENLDVTRASCRINTILLSVFRTFSRVSENVVYVMKCGMIFKCRMIFRYRTLDPA